MISGELSNQICEAIELALKNEYGRETLTRRLQKYGLDASAARGLGWAIEKLLDKHADELAAAREAQGPGLNRTTLIRVIDEDFKAGYIDRDLACKYLFYAGVQGNELTDHLDAIEAERQEPEIRAITESDMPAAIAYLDWLGEQYIDGNIDYRYVVGRLDPDNERPQIVYELLKIWHAEQLIRLREHVYSKKREAEPDEPQLLHPDLEPSWIDYCESEKPCEECPWNHRCYLWKTTLQMQESLDQINAPFADTTNEGFHKLGDYLDETAED